MKTGPDISLRTCRDEGYPVVTHGKSPLDPDQAYDLTISNPQHWPNGRLRPGTRSRDAWAVSTFVSYRALWESFLRGGDGIKSCCDFENFPLPDPESKPDFADFVHLAGIVRGYHGLEEFCWGR